ncbi:hypothetical protein Nepgr_008542 [Nepenthes gracilis]|uniref:Uncharacterized protein n=1 Tax=Nepenthes gracilis TaxID=150966 RepID=A0AAD3XJC0_NEPGR|nr:hypothetical protein Nepgr_008542 [Nepenthes gracilis]
MPRKSTRVDLFMLAKLESMPGMLQMWPVMKGRIMQLRAFLAASLMTAILKDEEEEGGLCWPLSQAPLCF